MNTSEKILKLEQLNKLASLNDVDGLKLVLNELETKLSGHYDWSYKGDKHYVECAMRDAILSDKKEILQLLLDAGASPDDYAYVKGDSGGVLPLMHFAAKSGNLGMVQILVENRAKIDVGLSAAVKEGQTDIVEYLLERGADADGFYKSYEERVRRSFIEKAAQDGNVRMVELLLLHGAKIESAFCLVCQKCYTAEIEEYNSAIRINYTSKQRISKLEYAFSVFWYNSSTFKIYCTPEATAFLQQLNDSLIDLDTIQNSETEKRKFLDNFIINLGKFGITNVDDREMVEELEALITSLREFDKKKLALEMKRAKLINAYTNMIHILMDYAMGCDFNRGLLFLADIDVSGVNFIGVSVNGEPVTHEMLRRKGLNGAENALVTMDDLDELPDSERKNALKNRLTLALQKNGRLITSDGVVNLVDLVKAVQIGDENVVRVRLLAGVDPNEESPSPLIEAAKKGHFEIVKMLIDSYSYHAEKKAGQLIAEAESQLKTASENTCLYVNKGRIKKIPFHFKSDHYIPVAIDNDYQKFVLLYKRYGNNLENDLKSEMESAETAGRHCLYVVARNGSREIITYSDYSDHTKLNELISSYFEKAYKTWDYHPVIFTDRTNRDLIRQLIETQYKAIDSRKHSIVEAIKEARQAKHLSIAEYLESQQSINEVNKEGNTLLHIAVDNADVKRVQELIRKGADVDIKNKRGARPIDCDAKLCKSNRESKEAYLEILKCLLDEKATVELSTLSAAIESGSEKALALLLPHAILNDVLYRDYSKNDDNIKLTKPWYVDLMYEAIDSRYSIQLLTLLKEFGADFNRNDGHNWTPLRCAISKLPSFENIISSVRDFRESIRGCEDRVGPETLDNVYDDLEKRYRERFDKELGLFNYLLDNGADPRISTKDGITPLYALIKDTDLYYLSNNGYEELLDKLLDKGADVNALTKTQSTPLHAAVISGDTAAVKYLIKHEACVNNKDNEGNTPLHLAAQLCFPISAKELIQAGADITIINGNKLTPLELLESSYEKKRLELNQNYNKAKEEKAKEPRSFFDRKESWQERENFHKYYQDKIDQLDSNYRDVRDVLLSVSKSSIPQFT